MITRARWRLIARLAVLSFMAGVGLADAASAASSPTDNWPQWRGPLNNGVAPTADPPTTWSESEHVRWKTKLPGVGSATPIVWENQIFIETAASTGKKVAPSEAKPAPPAPSAEPPPGEAPRRRPGGPGGFGGGAKPDEIYQFIVMALDRQTGRVLWQRVAREEAPHEGVRDNDGTFASPSPVTDGKRLFAFFGSRGLYAYDLAGRLEWSKDLGKMRIKMSFGEGSSPALYQDTIVVNWDNEDESFIVALDKNTGRELWKTPRDEKTTWSTPLIVEVAGKPQVITAATGKLRAYDLASGKQVWECAGLTPNAIPSPVFAEGVVYCMSGFRGHAIKAIRLGGTGDLTASSAIAWTYDKSTPYVPSPLLYGSRLYFLGDNNGILSCLDAASGRPLIETERLEGLPAVFASPIGAGNRVYLCGRNGATVVINNADKLEILATNHLEDKFDASPVAVGKELFLRGNSSLYCIAE